MKTKYLLSTLVLISLLLLMSGTASARPLNAALGTGFTYRRINGRNKLNTMVIVQV